VNLVFVTRSVRSVVKPGNSAFEVLNSIESYSLDLINSSLPEKDLTNKCVYSLEHLQLFQDWEI